MLNIFSSIEEFWNKGYSNSSRLNLSSLFVTTCLNI